MNERRTDVLNLCHENIKNGCPFVILHRLKLPSVDHAATPFASTFKILKEVTCVNSDVTSLSNDEKRRLCVIADVLAVISNATW